MSPANGRHDAGPRAAAHPLAGRLRRLSLSPTAPFREQWVAAEARRQAAAIPGLESEVDAFHNIILRLRRGRPATSTATFVAHLDHPGFVFPAGGAVPEPGAPRRYRARFEGRVRDEHFPGAPVRLYREANDPGIPGRVVEFSPVDTRNEDRDVLLEADSPADGALLAMWDVEPFAQCDGILHSRAADDLAGVAALLEMLHRLAASGEDVDVAVILTRAEEAGFCGLLCLLDEPRLPALVPGDTIFVSVEISREMPSVRLGEGAVIRAGDRSSTFDGRVTDTLAGLAAANGIVARRALMDGGTCEATAFARAGLRTGGVCAPVRGYHNQDPESHHVVAEQVALADLIALEALCRGLAVACNRGEQAPVGASIPFDRFLAKGRRELLSLPSESPAHQPVS